MTDPRYVLLRADQVKEALNRLSTLDLVMTRGEIASFVQSVERALSQSDSLSGYDLHECWRDLAPKLGYTIEHEPCDVDKRLCWKPGPIYATCEEKHVLWDVEPVRPEWPTNFFSTSCHDIDGRKKEHGRDTNVIGSGYGAPNGHAKHIEAISIEVVEGVVEKALDVNIQLGGTRFFSEPLRIAPGEIVPIKGSRTKRIFPKDPAAYEKKTGFPAKDIPEQGWVCDGGGRDDLEYVVRDVEIDKIRLVSLECFAIEVAGATSQARLRVNLHGPWFSSWYGPDDKRKRLPLEVEG